jgi:predicted O-methyltransferase YrrM
LALARERSTMTVPDDVEAFAEAVGPLPDDVIREMDARTDETGFPTVGPAVGGWLQQLAGLVGARRVFEFGSGFGYSAYWFARGLPADGEVVLTEIDEDELEAAREYLARGGYADRARFELGDAIEAVERYDGPFDVALIDNEKDRYVEAFEAIREKVPVGGVVVADNMTAGPFAFEDIHGVVLEGEETDDAMVRGVADYLEYLRADDAFETTMLPLGEGLAVSRRIA